MIVLLQIVVQVGYPYENDTSQAFRIVWSFFPPNPFAQGLHVLAQATSTPEDDGVRWSKRGKCAPNDDNCYLTMVWININLISKSHQLKYCLQKVAIPI